MQISNNEWQFMFRLRDALAQECVEGDYDALEDEISQANPEGFTVDSRKLRDLIGNKKVMKKQRGPYAKNEKNKVRESREEYKVNTLSGSLAKSMRISYGEQTFISNKSQVGM